LYIAAERFTSVVITNHTLFILREKSMRRITTVLSFLILSLVAFTAFAFQADITKVCFSPRGGCTESIVKEINAAKSEILVQAYSFTSAPIAKALLTAFKRGIKVEVILDKSQRKEKYTSATFLVNSGIPTFIDDMHAIAHNKIMIIDEETVITGSFNFTKAAEEKNAENLLIIRNADLAKIYMENWEKHREHSENYEGFDIDGIK
jgi:phosphatidylserine/phosphatidylglycerophosphate/cardiolipin synthase-like enzyme